MITNAQIAAAPVIHGSTPISQIGVQNTAISELQSNMCETF